MATRVVAGLLVIAALPAFAAGVGLRAGLWEVKLVRQTVDGRDTSTQMSASMRQMQQAMANLPPEQRARMDAMIRQSGVVQDKSGGFRVCVTPEMARRQAPIVDKDAHCQPAVVDRHGDETTFQFSCNTNGTSMNGKGHATMTGDTISTHTQVTTRNANGVVHEIQSDSEMKYLGADCGDVKPPATATHP